VEYLLGRPGINLDARAGRGDTAISIACGRGHLEVVKVLFGAGARIDPLTSGEIGALESAIVQGHLQAIKYLVEEAGADVQRAGFREYNALAEAASRGRANIVAYLLDRPGVDINAKTVGMTALDAACLNGCLETVKLLVAAGARVDPLPGDSIGALAATVSAGHLEVVKYLVEEAGADERLAVLHGITPLEVAARRGHDDLVEYLVNLPQHNFKVSALSVSV
jgi:ankyrin repeat protein